MDDEDDELVKTWYDKFLLIQNFKGFQYEELILQYISKDHPKYKKKPFSVRKSNPKEESKGIDIVIENSETGNNLYINVKPNKNFERISKAKNLKLNDEIIVLYYERQGDDIKISFSSEHRGMFDDFN